MQHCHTQQLHHAEPGLWQVSDRLSPARSGHSPLTTGFYKLHCRGQSMFLGSTSTDKQPEQTPGTAFKLGTLGYH